MDGIKRKREIIENIIREYAEIPYPNLKQTTIFDRQTDNYLLVVHGYENSGREYETLIHVEIINGKFWIQQDRTHDGIASDLMRSGISNLEIVLAFHAPELRKHTEFAVA